MEYKKAKSGNFYFGDLPLDNIFISEFMPDAPGDYVKVYLFARMYAELGKKISDKALCNQLGLSEEEVLDAWEYWENLGIIKRNYIDSERRVDFTVVFQDLKEQMFGMLLGGMNEDGAGAETDYVEPEVAATSVFGSAVLEDLLKKVEKTVGRTLSSSDMENIIEWVEDKKMPPEVVLLAVKYSAERGKSSFRYIDRVIEGWYISGYRTEDSVKEHLSEIDEKFVKYRRVMKALGFSRNSTEEEQRIMDTWFTDMGYTMDRVLDACGKTAGISNPNIKYVDGVLKGWKKDADRVGQDVNEEKPVTMAVLNQYYDYLRQKAEHEAEAHRIEIYEKVPEIKEIDDKIVDLGTRLTKAIILDGGTENSKALQEEIEDLNVDRAIVLTDHNYVSDYTDIKYRCDKCNDTGMTDTGERCSCMSERMIEAGEWQKRRERDGRR